MHKSYFYVKLDNCEREFLPPIPCHHHRHAGFSTARAECRAFEGWVLVEPMRRSWKFADPVTGATLTVSRSQLPLMPASACPLYSLQGMTCDPGLIAHFAMPRRADDDIKWLIVYVSCLGSGALLACAASASRRKFVRLSKVAHRPCSPTTSRSSFETRLCSRSKRRHQPKLPCVGTDCRKRRSRRRFTPCRHGVVYVGRTTSGGILSITKH